MFQGASRELHCVKRPQNRDTMLFPDASRAAINTGANLGCFPSSVRVRLDQFEDCALNAARASAHLSKSFVSVRFQAQRARMRAKVAFCLAMAVDVPAKDDALSLISYRFEP
jgi:hypothetical protein